MSFTISGKLVEPLKKCVNLGAPQVAFNANLVGVYIPSRQSRKITLLDKPEGVFAYADANLIHATNACVMT